MSDRYLNHTGLSRLWAKIKAKTTTIETKVAEVETQGIETQTGLENLISRVDMLQFKYHTQITGNSFEVTFANLDGVVVTGVWNETHERIEF